MRVQGKLRIKGESVFVHCAQTVTASGQNALHYDGSVSGSIIYAYVNNNPVNANDPSGLEPGDPYPTLNAANISAGRFNASQTLGMINATGLRLEFASAFYTIPGSNAFYYTPSVSSAYTSPAGFPTVNQNLTLSLVPPGAVVVGGFNHSHPNGQRPSVSDQLIARDAGNAFSSVGFTDGSVTGYNGTMGISGGNIGWQSTPLAPALPGGLTPFNFLDRSEPDYSPQPTLRDSTSSNGFNFGGTSAAGGFLLYPNKSNNNMTQSVYRK